MAFWLRSEERRVAARGRRVREERAALDDATRRLTGSIKRELAKPKALLAVFAAGFAFGFVRRGRERDVPRSRDEALAAGETGRLAKLVAAVLAGVRIYSELRRVAGFVERNAARHGGAGGEPSSGALRQDSPDETKQHETDDRDERRE